jgi:prephenate dehydratase
MSKIIIGIQGGVGSTNERACKFFACKHGWNDFEVKYLISTENVLRALKNNDVHYGTFAWKSSNGGYVLETQEAVKKYAYKKIDEEMFQLDHAIFQNSKIEKRKRVYIYSHPQALREHRSFLEKEFPNVEYKKEVDTAVAAKKLENNDYPLNSVVIAPASCASIYNLDIYLSDLPTNQGYFTTIYLVQNNILK